MLSLNIQVNKKQYNLIYGIYLVHKHVKIYAEATIDNQM